ncbi:alpha/beta fold hydrolase [Natroniella sp. ANB-PHB2]|uniref:intracellular short-chain-length polyhydroxyalkanoate depolymerase n=1 Tax=Natroniella sp. ANB-PHB2 TaxID=3384444 RepID=UPI0038D504AF
MTDIKLSSIELSNGESLNYRKKEEKNLLLIHGNMNSSKNWDLLMENMPQGYNIYAVDLRGFGNSTYNNEIESIKDFSDDLKLFVDKLQLKDFIIMGWSAGGAVAMQFCIDYQDYVDKLILLGSCSIKGFPLRKGGEYIKTKEDMAKHLNLILKMYKLKDKFLLDKTVKWFCKKFYESFLYAVDKPPEARYSDYIDEMLKQRNLVDINYALGYFNISHEHNGIIEGTGEVDKIKVPTLIIQGDKDELVTMDMAKGNLEGIGDNARLAIIEGVGHFPVIESPDRLIELVVDFIEEE